MGLHKAYRGSTYYAKALMGHEHIFDKIAKELSEEKCKAAITVLRQLFLDLRDYKTENTLTETEHATLKVLESS